MFDIDALELGLLTDAHLEAIAKEPFSASYIYGDKCVQLEYMLRIITKHFEGRITQLEHELKQFKDNGINNTTNVAINVISHDLLEDVRKLDEMVKNCKATVNPDLQYSGYS